MARITVPSAEALTTALGTSSLESLRTLARAVATEVQETDDSEARHKVIRTYLAILRQIDQAERFVRSEARMLARAEAAMDWMARRDEERVTKAMERVAERKDREEAAKAMPTSSVIDELRIARDKRTKRASRRPA